MVKTPTATTKGPKIPSKMPPHPFYKVAVLETLKRGNRAEIQGLIKGAQAVKAEYGDLDGLIAKLEAAAARAK
jgi:hypothetical protein